MYIYEPFTAVVDCTFKRTLEKSLPIYKTILKGELLDCLDLFGIVEIIVEEIRKLFICDEEIRLCKARRECRGTNQL